MRTWKIYKITFPEDEGVYIGCTTQTIEKRISCHKIDYNRDFGSLPLLHPIMKKYNGIIQKEWVTVLETCTDKQIAYEREEFWCTKIGSLNEMNGHKHSINSKRKLSNITKKRFANPENHPIYGKTGKDAPMWGKKHSLEARNKISKAKKIAKRDKAGRFTI